MRVLIATTQVPFVTGGAELHARSLCSAIRQAGHQAEICAIPFRWYPPEQILDHALACRLIDLTDANGQPVDRVIGLKFPAWLVRHPNKVLWILHQYRSAYDLWDLDDCDLHHYAQGRQIRDAVRKIDESLPQEARRIYANSENVCQRLQQYCGIPSETLYHPPPDATSFYCDEEPKDGPPFLLYPSRIEPLKRQSLILEALAQTSEDVRVHFIGAPNTDAYLAELQEKARKLKVDHRVAWLGRVSVEAKLEAYAQCRGVLFTPVDEDYGYITLEAMLSSKPVITCEDSGGPLEFVEDGRQGYISKPSAEAIAEAMDRLWADPSEAKTIGRRGRATYDQLGISWSHAVEKLLA